MEFGEILKFYRKRAGLTQEELAQRVFLSGKTIGLYETGTRMPSLEKLTLLAKALNIQPAYFLDLKQVQEDMKQYEIDCTPILTVEEQLKLFNVATSDTDYLVVSLLLECGFKMEDVLCLSFDDINLYTDEKKESFSIISPLAYRHMFSLRDEVAKKWVDYLNQPIRGELFRLSKESLLKKLEALFKKANIEKPITNHLFQKTIICTLLKSNIDLTTIQYALGHHDIRDTIKYIYKKNE